MKEGKANRGGFELARISITDEGSFDLTFTMPGNQTDPEQISNVWALALAELVMAAARGMAELQGTISEKDARQLIWLKCTDVLAEGRPLSGDVGYEPSED
jgi:hypothetical protein